MDRKGKFRADIVQQIGQRKQTLKQFSQICTITTEVKFCYLLQQEYLEVPSYQVIQIMIYSCVSK